MAASAELLLTALASIPHQRAAGRLPAPSERPGTMELSEATDPDTGPEGSCLCGCLEAPLTSEPPLADTAPLTSEPPLAAEAALTSEPNGTAACAEVLGSCTLPAG